MIVQDVFPYCEKLDLVLVMTVEPGFGGQSFMADQVRDTDSRKHDSFALQVFPIPSPFSFVDPIAHPAS